MKSTSRFTKIAVSAGLVVATGAGVLGITSFASAQLAGTPTPVAVVTTDDTTPASSDSNNVEARSATDVTRISPLSIAAKELGVTEAELRTELAAGKSIAQVAEAKNVDLQKIITALVNERKDHIASHVAEGKLTQAQADAKLADIEARVTEMVNKTGLPMKEGKGGHGGRGGHAKFVSDGLASVLNLSVEELHTQLRDGKSLAAIAEAQNVDISKVKDVLTSEFKAHLAEEVKSGEHTQAEADEKLAQFESRIDDMVNGVRPQGGMHRGGPAHGSRGELQFSGSAQVDPSGQPTSGSFN